MSKRDQNSKIIHINFYISSNFDAVFLWIDCDMGFRYSSSGFSLSVMVFE